jgi:hypothetical protein
VEEAAAYQGQHSPDSSATSSGQTSKPGCSASYSDQATKSAYSAVSSEENNNNNKTRTQYLVLIE